MRALLASGLFLAGCLAPVAYPAPTAPAGTRAMIMVAQRPNQTPVVEIRDSDFDRSWMVSEELPWIAFYYACSSRDLNLNDNSSPKPVPQTWAAQRLVGGEWRAIPPEELDAARATVELAHPDLPCADLQLDAEQLVRLEVADGITHGTWLDPDREEIVVVDELGHLWRGDRTTPPSLWVTTPAPDLLTVEYSPTHRAVFGVGLDRATRAWMTVRIDREVGLQVLDQLPAPPDPELIGRSAYNLLGFAPGDPFVMYLVAYNAALAVFEDGQWNVVASGWEKQVLTGLAVLGRDDLLVLGRCPSLESELGTGNLGCEQSVAHWTRGAGGEWRETHERTPGGRILSSLARGKDGTVYAGTVNGQIYARDPIQGGWREIEGTGGTSGVERLTAFEDGVLAGLDNAGLYRVRSVNAGRCPKLTGHLEHRGLLTSGSRFALIGPSQNNSAFGVQFGQTRDFDCRLPSLVQSE